MRLTSACRILGAILALSGAAAAGAQTAPSPGPKAAKAAAAEPAAPRKARPATKPPTPEADKPRAGYRVEPAPSWVVPAVERPGIATDRAPMSYRVIDEQVRVEPTLVSAYTHLVRVPRESAGLAQASQIEIEFDPSIQTLSLHHLDVVRDGRRINKIDRQRFQVLQRETQLERMMYDGRATLSIVLDDVRVGDEIDWAYSLQGANPVFGGKFVHQVLMGSYRGPVAVAQMRLLAPRGRTIAYRAGPEAMQVREQDLGEWHETVFRREAVPQLHADEGAPYSVALAQQLQFSEYAGWDAVARWGEALFAFGDPGPLVGQKVQEIKAQTADRGEQLRAALQFVQKDVRYFGTEIGPGTHRPAAPAQVMAQRFGDCKDKVRLLMALLRGLDIPATPVLVSHYQRGAVAQWLPSPLAFDHVIARVDLDGTAYWLDATRTHQTGALAARQAVGFGKGLPLVDGTTALADLPAPYDIERWSVKDTIRVQQFAADPTLESRVTYRGDLAEGLREAVATRGTQDLGTALAASYLKTYPKLRSTAPLRVESSEQDDAVTFVQTFALPDFWRFPEQQTLVADLVHWGVAEALLVPKSENRRDPLAFSYPGVYRHVIVMEYPDDVYAQAGSQQFEDGDDHVTLKTVYETDLRRAEYRAEVRLGTDQVAAAEWPAYTAKLTKLMPRLGFGIRVPAVPPGQMDALNQAYKSTVESIRSGRLKFVTKTQVEAHLKTVALSAQIAAGRLAPPLEAQALAERGMAYDHLGRLDEAERDFTRALALAPDETDTQKAAATNAKLRGRFDRAIELSSRVLDRNPRDSDALITRAQARYFKKDLAGARADLEAALKDRSVARRGYPLIWLSLALRAEGQDPLVLDAAYPRDSQGTDWPRPLVDMALGKTSPDSAIVAAKAARNPPESLCEAYFYIGEKYLAEGNPKRAAEFWRKSVDQGVVEFNEHGAAVLRLAAAGGR